VDGWLHLSGIDEGWEGCGQGITVNGRKTQHYANGTPAINEKFPDMAVSSVLLMSPGSPPPLHAAVACWLLPACLCAALADRVNGH
jgi:hypothetical protein